MKSKKIANIHKLSIVKANRLVEAAYRMTLVEKRIILLAIASSRKSGKGLSPIDFVTISATDYLEFFGDEHNVYEQLKEAARSLFLREFTLYDKDPETKEPRVITGRWLSATSYIDNVGRIQIQFSPIIIPYITMLEREFTKYDLEWIAEFSSPYAIRLYELLIQWVSVGTRELEVAWLKKIFLLEDKYRLLSDFKKYVIVPSIEQINKYTNITVSYTQRKTGCIVSHLNFIIVQKDTSPKRLEAPETSAVTTKPVDPTPQPPKPTEGQKSPKTKNTSPEVKP